MNPALSWAFALAVAAIWTLPGALMSLLDRLGKRVADVGPDDEAEAARALLAATLAGRRRAALTGHDEGCSCPPCLTLAWGEAFGAQCDAEMRGLDRRGATGGVA